MKGQAENVSCVTTFARMDNIIWRLGDINAYRAYITPVKATEKLT